ncbi:vacuolar protein sorting-associated protein 26C [Stomoxys calcitrans]|uniref:Vacuolar protein sorting-associated protein 26C n=1 Tax=Stomoxys calcitrans TaxID=35570 RepID=A0A1I8QEN8_STOCA|nr:vacuolar protein sorting-associated protein 26C [Stomoxys calcitrans]
MGSNALNFEIKLKRENKIYYENDVLVGCVHFSCPSEAKHDGISLSLEGIVNLQLSNSKSVGLLDAFYNSLKPIQLLNSTIDLSAPGKLNAGNTEFHFEFPLKCNKEPKVLYETYHGLFININYQLRCDVKRSFLAKSLQKTQQFCIQYKPPSGAEAIVAPAKEANFSISPESIQKNSKERITMPRFLITGKLEKTEFCITQPLRGSLTIQHTEVAIKSIELQLLRVETCGCKEGYAKDSTEIQTIQIVDGNICPRLEIPIYMVLPRLFSCPTLITKNFKIEFEVNLVIVFKDDYIISENFPIVLKRLNGPLGSKSSTRGI